MFYGWTCTIGLYTITSTSFDTIKFWHPFTVAKITRRGSYRWRRIIYWYMCTIVNKTQWVICLNFTIHWNISKIYRIIQNNFRHWWWNQWNIASRLIIDCRRTWESDEIYKRNFTVFFRVDFFTQAVILIVSFHYVDQARALTFV